MSKHDYEEHDDWWFPLLLSSLAGASTCVGAGIVFVFSPETIQKSMPFSLALAGSVMITVSVISIGPKCLEDIEWTNMDWKSIRLLTERLGCFGLGCLGYYLLSKCAFPEPPESIIESSIAAAAAAAAGGKQKNSTTSTMSRKEKHDNDMEQQIHQDSLSPSSKHASPSTRMRRTNIITNINANQNDSTVMSDPPLSSTSSSSSRNSYYEYYSFEDHDQHALEEEESPLVETMRSSTSSNAKSKTKSNYRRNPKSILSSLCKSWSSWSKGSDLPTSEAKRSWRVALLLFVSLLCHNFPEGLAVVASTVESRELGMTVAIGILIHNIPEGIAIAVPCLAARPDNPWLAFWLASGSGLAEPAGAWMALTVFQGKTNIANVLSCVAGIMCMVAVMELYPEAFRHVQPQEKRGTQSIVAGTVCGILVMVATECII